MMIIIIITTEIWQWGWWQWWWSGWYESMQSFHSIIIDATLFIMMTMTTMMTMMTIIMNDADLTSLIESSSSIQSWIQSSDMPPYIPSPPFHFSAWWWKWCQIDEDDDDGENGDDGETNGTLQFHMQPFTLTSSEKHLSPHIWFISDALAIDQAMEEKWTECFNDIYNQPKAFK